MAENKGILWAQNDQTFEDQENEVKRMRTQFAWFFTHKLVFLYVVCKILALKSFYENTNDLQVIQIASRETNTLNALKVS